MPRLSPTRIMSTPACVLQVGGGVVVAGQPGDRLALGHLLEQPGQGHPLPLGHDGLLSSGRVSLLSAFGRSIRAAGRWRQGGSARHSEAIRRDFTAPPRLWTGRLRPGRSPPWAWRRGSDVTGPVRPATIGRTGVPFSSGPSREVRVVRVGFVGLGTMGAAMAANLPAPGFTV